MRRAAGREVTSTAAEQFSAAGDELAALREIGRHWADSPIVRRARSRRLPVDPNLGRFRPPTPTRFGRFAPVQLFEPEAPGEIVATEPAAVPESAAGRFLVRLKRLVVGPPLPSTAVVHERMRKLIALPVLGSDLLSSVAYGPEAMLSVLVIGGVTALRLSLPISAVLVLLMIALGLSYRQTLRAYPSGAGSYIVAGDNLGPTLGLVAASGLLTDYVLTVAVSVSSGVDAIVSAVPRLAPDAVAIGVAAVVILLAGNLRGVRQAGALFATPTYAFIVAILLLIAVGFAHAAGRGFSAVPPPPLPATQGVTLLLILRAFSSGATSMTGVEAVSNAVPAFEPVEWRNARSTLTWMVGLMVVIFSGLVLLVHLDGVIPRAGQTVLSQLAHLAFGTGPLYAYTQAATTLILLLAANTAFNDFPRLLYFMARDDYAPRQFLRMGDRLAFSNGIVTLAVAAAVVFLAFHGHTEALIPLYAVGVFLAFTLSQAGMVVHWWRRRSPHWRKSMLFNGAGAVASASVGLTAAITKFVEGAWLVVIAIPVLILICQTIDRHYRSVNEALTPHPLPDHHPLRRRVVPLGPEDEESPEQIVNLIVVPVARLHLASLRALAYAASFEVPILVIHIAPDEEEAEAFRRRWQEWGDHLRLETIVSPYRALVPPLAHYLTALRSQQPELTLTVVLYELVVKHRWHRLLHVQLAARLRRALQQLSDVVITSVPYHLPS